MYHHRLVMAKPQRAKRQPQFLRMADLAAHLLDSQRTDIVSRQLLGPSWPLTRVPHESSRH
jgi:hypothetical protein